MNTIRAAERKGLRYTSLLVLSSVYVSPDYNFMPAPLWVGLMVIVIVTMDYLSAKCEKNAVLYGQDYRALFECADTGIDMLTTITLSVASQATSETLAVFGDSITKNVLWFFTLVSALTSIKLIPYLAEIMWKKNR